MEKSVENVEKPLLSTGISLVWLGAGFMHEAVYKMDRTDRLRVLCRRGNRQIFGRNAWEKFIFCRNVQGKKGAGQFVAKFFCEKAPNIPQV